MVFRPFTPSEGKGIEAGKATFQLAHAFADGHAAPGQLTFRMSLAPWPQFLTVRVIKSRRALPLSELAVSMNSNLREYVSCMGLPPRRRSLEYTPESGIG